VNRRCTVRRTTAAFLLLSLLIFLAFSGGSSGAEDGTWTETKFNYGGYAREYALYLPAAWKRGGPLVVFFPGFTLGYRDYRKGSGLIEASDRYGTALLIPNGMPVNPKYGAWLLNPRVWDMGQVKDRKEYIDDSAFVDRLIKDVTAQIGADPSKTFVAGHSNGAYFAHFMVGKYPGRFAGIASFMGRFFKTALPKSIPPIPTIIFNGMQDPVLPIEGKEGKNPWDSVPAAQECIDHWATIMGLEKQPSRQLLEEGGSQLAYRDALGRVMLVAAYIDNQGHWIPGHRPKAIQGIVAGPLNLRYDAPDKAWRMFMSVGPQGGLMQI